MSKNNKHLHQFLHQLSLHQVLTEGQWWAVSSDELWHLNFSKEIVPIKTNATYPKGAVGIRVDDNFWTVAALPPECEDIPLEDIVAALWPEISEKENQA